MNIAVIGNGGREFAIGWKLKKENPDNQIFFIPGNGATDLIGKNAKIDTKNFEAIKQFLIEQNINLVVVGPEQPLVDGITDYLQNIKNLTIVGPSAKGALLEGSKVFAKNFMQKYNIPTAQYKSFSQNQFSEAVDFLKGLEPPFVIKVDGLAAGKGVFISQTLEEAKKNIEDIFSGKFGKSGNNIVIEQFLKGIEFSVFIITNGKDYKILPIAKDYKRIYENDKGPNTGGMGAISPVPFANDILLKVKQKIIEPTLKGITNEKLNYKGFLYFGLINVNNEPYVLEYNARLGDPETQIILPLIEDNFLNCLYHIDKPDFNSINLKISNKYSIGVVLASEGYPMKYETGKEISIPETLPENIHIFYAGVKKENQKLLTSGGRVLTVVATDTNLENAKEQVYKIAEAINFENKYFRKDIGYEFKNL